MQLDLLLIGDCTPAEFRGPRQELSATSRLWEYPDVAAALAGAEALPAPPAVIVLAQSYPGQFDAGQVAGLGRAWPLARIWLLLGSWCEGEPRTGQPCGGVQRVYWHQWSPRWRQELARLEAERCPGWALPVTATEEERLLAAAECPLPRRQGLVVVAARTPAMAEMLADACRLAGYAAATWEGPPRRLGVRGAAAALLDATDGQAGESARLAALARELPGVPIVVLMDFPRIEDRQRMLDCGAAAILAKPLVIDDLWWQLDRLTEAAA